MQGKSTSQVHEAGPGDIVAVAKVDGLEIGDTIAYTNHAPKLPPPHFPTPMFGLAVEPKNRGDEQKISAGLHKIAEEDPTVKVTHDPQTHELVISGVSQLHLDIIRERLKARFGVEVITKEPKIPYRETITATGPGDHKHKKQTGGRGQFAEVHLRIYPLSREIKTQEQCEEQFANKSKFEKLRSVPLRPGAELRVHRPHRRRHDPEQLHPGGREGVQGDAGARRAGRATASRTAPSRSTSASTTTWTRPKRRSRRRPGRRSSKAFLAARPALLEPIVKLEITVPDASTPGRCSATCRRSGPTSRTRTACPAT